MIYKIIYLLTIIVQILCSCTDDTACLFCSKNAMICMQCTDGYSLNTSNVCTQNQQCMFNQLISIDGSTCLTECPTGQIDYFNVIAQNEKCTAKGLCPQSYSNDVSDQIVDVFPNIIYLSQVLTPVICIKNKLNLDIVSVDTGLSYKKIVSDTANDQIRGYKINGSIDLGSLVVTWFSSAKLVILNSQTNTQVVVTLLNIVAEADQILDAFITFTAIDGFSVKVLAKETPQKQISYISISLNTMNQVKVNTLVYGGSYGNILKGIFVSDSLILGMGISLPNMFASIAIQLSNNLLSANKICNLNQISQPLPKLQLVKSKSELIYLSQGNILTSSFSVCYSQQIPDQLNVISVTLDEDASKLFTISASLIKSYTYSSDQGVKSISEITATALDNSQLQLVSCMSLGFVDPTVITSKLILICNNLVNNNLTELNYDFSQGLVQFLTLFSNNFSTQNIIYLSQLKVLIVYGVSQLNVYQGVVAANNEDLRNSLGCVFLIQSQLTDITLQSKRMSVISNSLGSSCASDDYKLIYQVNSNISYNPAFSQLTKIRQLLIAATQQTTPIVFNSSTLLPYSFQSLKIMAMSVKLATSVGNIVVSPLTSNNQIIFESLLFTDSVQGSSLVIMNKTQVIIRKIFVNNLKIINTSLIKIINCQSVYIGDVVINNVTLTDSVSSLFNIIQSQQVIFQNVNITLSSLNAKPLIVILQSNLLSFSNLLIAGNYFVNNLLFGIVFSVSGVNSSSFKGITLRSNMNVQSIRVMSSFVNLQNQTVQGYNTQTIGSSILIKDNIGRYGQQIYINSDLAMFSAVTCLNNSQLAGNGTIHFSQSSVNIQDSYFSLNKAYAGGALYFNQTKFAQIINSQFINNNASAAGGAILVSQALLLLNSTTIKQNNAFVGGGVRIEKGLLSFLQYDQQTVISNNFASLFGNNIASRLQSFKIYVNGELVKQVSDQVFYPVQKTFLEKSNLTIQNAYSTLNVRSGQQIDILIQLFDQDGKLFAPDASITYPPTINLEINLLGGVMKSNFVILLGENFIADYNSQKQGYNSAEGLVFQGTPGLTLPVFIVQNFIENPSRTKTSRVLQAFTVLQENQIQIQQNKVRENKKRRLVDFTSVLGILTSDITNAVGLLVQFRTCIKGEILKEINADMDVTECLPCPSNSYTLYNNETECKKCPDSAQICENSTIVLKNGFWRENLETDLIFQCRADLESCEENDTLINQIQCKKGYTGPLCEGCDIWGKQWGRPFSLNGIGGQCIECDSQDKQTAYIVLIFSITTIYLLFGIINAMQNNSIHSLAYYVRILGFASISKSCMRDESSQYIKVLVHYLQLFAVINSISLQLPDFVSFIPKYTGNPGTSFILSSNCFLQQIEYKNIMQARVLQSSLLPFVYCISVILIYLFLTLVKFIRFQRSFIYTTFIFLTMFFQPDSVMFILSSIGCKTLGENQFLLADANFQCYTDNSYRKFLYFYTVPSLVVWSLIPIIFLILLRKRKDKLHLIVTKQLFGYLYLEYKDKYYYFEFFRCLMKIMIVIFYTLTDSDQQFKLNCVVLFISFYIFVSNKLHPFQNSKLAHIDVLTHTTLLTIILFNMITYTTDTNSKYYTTLKSLTIITNIGYIIYMVIIILLLKMNKFSILTTQILQVLQQRLGKCIPLLMKFKIDTHARKSLVLFRWKLLKKNRKRIVSQYYDEKQVKTNGVKVIIEKDSIKNQDNQTSIVNQLIKLRTDNTIKQTVISSPLIETVRPLNNQVQTYRNSDRNSERNEKGIIEGDLELFSSGFLSQNLDGEKIDIEFYSNPVSSKFIFDKNILMSQVALSPTLKFPKMDS